MQALPGLAPATGLRGAEVSENDLMTAAEVGRYLRVHAKKVYALPIPQVRISDRRVRFLWSDVQAYVRRSRRGA